MKRLLAVLLSALLLFALLPGCGQKEETGPITLKWVMPGPGVQADSEKVWAEFNQKLKTYPGFEEVTVEFDVIPAADYAQKFLLMQTAGEPMDIVQTYSLDFAKEARNATFLPLDDYLKDLPDLTSELPEWLLDCGKLDGVSYIIPNYQIFAAKKPSIRTSQELIDKYWNQEEAEKFLQSHETLDQECFDYIEEYLKALKDNGEIGLGFYLGGVHYKGFESIIGPYAVKQNTKGGATPEVVNIYLTDEAKAFYSSVASWYQKGYIRKDALSAKSSEDFGKTGGISVWIGEKNKDAYEETKYDYKVGNIELDPNYYRDARSAAGGLGIYSQSAHPKTAMKLIDLMNTKKGAELYNMLCYGLEGVHYEKVSDDRIKTFHDQQQPTSSEAYGLWTWVVGNTENAWLTQFSTDDEKTHIFEEINNGPDTKPAVLPGFYPDLSEYQTEYDQLNAIIGEYKAPLASGALPDWKATYAEFCDKMEKCSEKEIRAELQKQVDEYWKNR